MKLLRVGLALLTGALGSASAASGASPAPPPDGQAPPQVEWHATVEAGRAAARESDRLVLLYFWIEGSSFCEAIYRDVLTSERGAVELGNFACVSVRADDPAASSLLTELGVTRLPTLAFTRADGAPEDALPGGLDLETFLREAARIRRGERTVSDWRGRAAAKPDDLDVRLQLGLQLEHVGEATEASELFESIKRDDPDGATVAGAQLHLYDVFAEVRNAAGNPSDSGTYELAPLYAHMPKVKPLEIQHEGWRWITDVEKQRGDRVRERAAWPRLWKTAADEETRMECGFRALLRYFEMGEGLGAKDLRFCSDVLRHFESNTADRPGLVAPAFVHHARAITHALHGRRDEALVEVERAIALAPDVALHQRLRDLLQPTAAATPEASEAGEASDDGDG